MEWDSSTRYSIVWSEVSEYCVLDGEEVAIVVPCRIAMSVWLLWNGLKWFRIRSTMATSNIQRPSNNSSLKHSHQPGQHVCNCVRWTLTCAVKRQSNKMEISSFSFIKRRRTMYAAQHNVWISMRLGITSKQYRHLRMMANDWFHVAEANVVATYTSVVGTSYSISNCHSTIVDVFIFFD